MVNITQMWVKATLLASLLASSIVIPAALAQAAKGTERPGGTPPAVSAPAPAPGATSSHHPSSVFTDTRSPRQAMMYSRLWGVDNIRVRETASGSLLRFSYRVVDSTKAMALNDEKQTPYLIDGSTGAKLGIPQTEKIGKLRQVATPKNGREYWMVFLNQGRVVKPGNRVSVVIGKLRVDGLVVESSHSAFVAQKP